MTEYFSPPYDHSSQLGLGVGNVAPILFESGLPLSISSLAGKAIQARSSVQNPGQDAKCVKPNFLKGRVLTWIR